MKTVTVHDRSPARQLLPKGPDQEIVVMRDGHAVALVVPFDDDDVEWYAHERDPVFIESIRRAREQVKRGETISDKELDRLFSDRIDGIDLSGFSPPISIGTLQRTKCSAVPTGPGVYLVLRPDQSKPKFLEKSVGGWFKQRDPSVAVDVLQLHWLDAATVLYIGKGNGKKGLKRRLREYVQFGLGKRIGHYGGRLIWHLQNHQQLLVRWRLTGKRNPDQVESELIEQFKSVHASRPFANLAK